MSIKTYTQNFNARKTEQTEPIPGRDMVKNSAGGYVFAVDDWVRLERFLVLGSEGGSYYASEKKLTRENAECVLGCVKADGERAVRTIVAVSKGGRAPKDAPAIFALAIAISTGDARTKRLAMEAVPHVCRTGRQLFEFVEAARSLRGWGRTLREAVARWYTQKDPRDLAYQVTKYAQRNGISHRDLLRFSHARADGPALNAVLRYACRGAEGMGPITLNRRLRAGGTKSASYAGFDFPLPGPIEGAEAAKKATTAAEVVRLIREYDLVREVIPTHWLKVPAVWEALLEKMPLTAVIRNLGKMSSLGLLTPLSAASAKVRGLLADQEALRRARVHPLSLLVALNTYRQGHGELGKLTWTPDQQVCDALDGAFYLAFGSVVPTGKRVMLAVDVSGSMADSKIAGMTGITPRVAAAALALVTAAVEPNHLIVAFSAENSISVNAWVLGRRSSPTPVGPGFWWGNNGGTSTLRNGIAPLAISPRMRLDDAIAKAADVPMGNTDCALPMLYAAANNLQVDAFITLTDNESFAGKVHAAQALRQYRQKSGIPAKSVCVAMVANSYSVADPEDAGQLDCVGLSTDTPSVISNFIGADFGPM